MTECEIVPFLLEKLNYPNDKIFWRVKRNKSFCLRWERINNEEEANASMPFLNEWSSRRGIRSHSIQKSKHNFRVMLKKSRHIEEDVMCGVEKDKRLMYLKFTRFNDRMNIMYRAQLEHNVADDEVIPNMPSSSFFETKGEYVINTKCDVRSNNLEFRSDDLEFRSSYIEYRFDDDFKDLLSDDQVIPNIPSSSLFETKGKDLINTTCEFRYGNLEFPFDDLEFRSNDTLLSDDGAFPNIPSLSLFEVKGEDAITSKFIADDVEFRCDDLEFRSDNITFCFDDLKFLSDDPEFRSNYDFMDSLSNVREISNFSLPFDETGVDEIAGIDLQDFRCNNHSPDDGEVTKFPLPFEDKVVDEIISDSDMVDLVLQMEDDDRNISEIHQYLFEENRSD